MVSYWPVMEEGRDESRAYLVFSIYGSAQDQPSVSLIYRNWEVCRVDVKPKNDRDFNPEYALRPRRCLALTSTFGNTTGNMF